MGTQLLNKQSSWESLSSNFSNLEISFSQDSCYGSDEISVASTNPTSVNTTTVSPSSSALEAPRPAPKSILKRPYSEIEEDEKSESGYASEATDHEFDDSSDEEDEDEDEEYYITAWDSDSDAMSDSEDEEEDADDDDGESMECSFISFESNVRFDPNVVYIEAPKCALEDTTDADSGMTCHEIMERARALGQSASEDPLDDFDLDDIENDTHAIFYDIVRQLPEEHSRDIVDLDKRLFAAYMNGINGVTDSSYKSRLHTQVEDIVAGGVQSPYLNSDSPCGVYLDHALNHVIGTFPHILIAGELDELMRLSDEKKADRRTQNGLVRKIEHLLSERLGSDRVTIGADELCFFAGGIAYALENWKTCLGR
ncbi:uncharacterized protein BDW47DRAFT_5750 [Aspergillus candidus]|uniref:Uncharacterized protein n=1 Tax=Aspergillus candidus TaxID=41067 RepID=A0A2I2FHH5_ASPCN|nr:hypothetical protein BDW47DRAFT_5750 [Aspergillus candidus]PLB40085.1 hypothetical protein BDW47DRAFT_5750 [Aspergillus candidus]